MAFIAVVAVGALIGAGLYALRNTDDSSNTGPIAEPGQQSEASESSKPKQIARMDYIKRAGSSPGAFSDSTVSSGAASIIDSATLPSPSLHGPVSGGTRTLYATTGKTALFDVNPLLNNLRREPSLNTAFAQGIGINPDDVETYVKALQPLILTQDTWVTIHEHHDGRAVPRQAILQRGTAVLVDAYGAPRVRCAGGTPLAEAWTGYTAPEAKDDAWDGYAPGNVLAITESEAPRDKTTVRDVEADKSGGATTEATVPAESMADQADVRSRVTNSTPRTVPNDMQSTPDYELLERLGMSPATEQDGTTRPTGNERFRTNSGSFDPEVHAEPAATEVDGKKFEVNPGIYHFVIDGGRGWCLFKQMSGPHPSSMVCAPTALKTDLLAEFGGDGDVATPLSEISFATDLNSFRANSTANTESPSGGAKPQLLRLGEAVEINGIYCTNSTSEFGCEKSGSTFTVRDGKGAYIDGSSSAIGETCGTANSSYSRRQMRVRVANGNVDCAQALEVGTTYLNTPADAEHGNHNVRKMPGGWVCTSYTAREATLLKQAGS